MPHFTSPDGQIYRAEKQIGKGQFGEVFLVTYAKHGGTKRKCVIKKVTPRDASELKLANEEVEIMRLNDGSHAHPNVIRYYDHWMRGRDLLIVMEYAENGCLSDLIREYRNEHMRMSQMDVCNKIQQLLSGLAYCHETLGVLHRDIKPDNILIDKFGHLKLADFGVSKQVPHLDALCGTVIGTPLYMPPEMYQERAYSFKVDVWMMGSVLYEMMALEPPWIHEMTGTPSLQALGQFICSHEIRTEHIRAHYSRDLCRLVVWMLEKSAEHRPTAAEALKLFEMQAPPTNAALLYRSCAAACIQSKFRSSLRRRVDAARHNDDAPNGVFDKREEQPYVDVSDPPLYRPAALCDDRRYPPSASPPPPPPPPAYTPYVEPRSYAANAPSRRQAAPPPPHHHHHQHPPVDRLPPLAHAGVDPAAARPADADPHARVIQNAFRKSLTRRKRNPALAPAPAPAPVLARPPAGGRYAAAAPPKYQRAPPAVRPLQHGPASQDALPRPVRRPSVAPLPPTSASTPRLVTPRSSSRRIEQLAAPKKPLYRAAGATPRRPAWS